jgi:N-acetylglutamate synthase-like GNAT family acetyltransferase
MYIREFRQDDSDDLSIIQDQMNQFLRKVYRPTKAGYENRSRIERSLNRIVAISEGKVVGTSQYYFDEKILRILGLAVREDYRLKGVARSIINHITELANSSDCISMRLSTVKETGNVIIFERIGFKIVGEHQYGLLEGLNGEYVTDIEMELRLKTKRGRVSTFDKYYKKGYGSTK